MANKHFYAALFTLVLTAGLILTVANRGVPRVLHTNLQNLPMEIAGYQGREDSFAPGVYDVLQADLHVYRQYRSPAGESLSLYIGYYGTARGGRTGHNPYACLPGAGWGIVETGTVEVYPSYYPRGVMVNYVVAGKDGVNNVMLHWYQTAGDRVLATGLQQNIQRFKGRVLHNRNDGAYVQVNALAQEPGIPGTKDMVIGFGREVLELLPAYWPEEG
jgi:EpsI family protein